MTKPAQLHRALLAASFVIVPVAARAQEPATVSGRVTSAAGAPLAGASVVVEGMQLGGMTNDAGRFSFVVPAARARGQSAALSVRLIGYRPTSAPITLAAGASITHDFVLSPNPLRLGEVVVTGSGTTTTREALGSVVNSVRPEEIRKSAEPNIVNALAAKSPNVEVTSQAGDPGAGSGIIIRGLKTIEGNGQPLFVVDGMPIDNSTNVTDASDVGVAYTNRAADVNPNDIESIEVLQGAAAASIYGLRAANGVILITTKSGRSGPTRYALSSTSTFDEVNREIPLQHTFSRGRNGATITCADPDQTCYLRSWGQPLPAGTKIYNHFDELFRTGHTYDNTLQVSGGDDRRSFLLSVGSTNQRGVLKGPNSFYDRRTARLKASQQLTSRLRVGGNVSYSDVNASFIQKGNNLNGVMLGSMRQPPEFNPFPYETAEGWQRAWSVPIVTRAPTNADEGQIFDNPFWVLNKPRNTSRVGRSIGNVTLNYLPLEWLSVDYTLGADYGNENRLEGLPPYSAGDAFTGQLWQGTYTNLIVDHNLVATARRSFGEAATGKLSLGQNLNSTRFDRVQVKGTGFIDPSLFTLNNLVQTNLTPENDKTHVNIAAYFATGELALAEQLYLSAGVRADQTSTLSKEHRTAYFPKGSVAWNVTHFLGNTEQRGVLSYLKARAAVGEVGRQPFPYQILTTYTGTPLPLAYGTGATSTSQAGQGGLRSGTTRGDRDLRYERTREIEAGLDYGLLSQRVDGSATYYAATTRDVIFALPLPASTGYQFAVQNGGQVTNKGLEVALNARVVDLPETKWEIGVNYARNRNKLVDLRGADFVNVTGGFGVSTAVKGYPLGTFYGTDFARCRYGVADDQNVEVEDAAGATVNLNVLCRAAKAPDGALYVGADGFPIQDPANRVLGNPNPDWLGSLRSSVTLLRKLQISALVDVKHGGDVWNGTRGALQSYGTSKYTEGRATCTSGSSGLVCTGNEQVFGRTIVKSPGVVGPGAGEKVPVGENWWRTGLGNNFNGPTGQFVESGGFTRLREVSLAYTFDQAFVKSRLGLSSVDVRLAGRNLALWTKYSGIDPETNLTGPIGTGRGQDYFNTPQTRSWVINFNLNR